jgi:hypothetical protein
VGIVRLAFRSITSPTGLSRFPWGHVSGAVGLGLPSAVFLAFFVGELTSHPLSHVLVDFFWPWQEGEAALGVLFFTFPVLSSVLYAVVMFLARRRAPERK